MSVNYIDEKGASKPMEMGCYGIGVTPVVAAAIEENYDERGIIWPDPMGPLTVAVIPPGYHKSETGRAPAEKPYAELAAARVEAFIDERKQRPGGLPPHPELIGI